ncbi:MAG: hypothetical protein Q4A21_01175 [bacterium]|nr:hypothetical protein [bacterium]
MKKKNQLIKVALLGFCMIGLVACGKKSGNYDTGLMMNGEVNAVLALYDHLPAQDVVIPMDSESQANKYIADIVGANYVKNAIKVIDNDQVYVIVTLSGENAVDLELATDVFEKEDEKSSSKEEASTSSTEKP